MQLINNKTTSIEEYERIKKDGVGSIRLIDKDNWIIRDWHCGFKTETFYHYTKQFYDYSGEYVVSYNEDGNVYRFTGRIGKRVEINIIANTIYIKDGNKSYRIGDSVVEYGNHGCIRYKILEKSDYDYRDIINRIKTLKPRIVKMLEVGIVQYKINNIIEEVL